MAKLTNEATGSKFKTVGQESHVEDLVENGQTGGFVRRWRSFPVLVNDGETIVTDGVFEKPLGRNGADTVEYFKGILIETKETGGGVYLRDADIVKNTTKS